MPPVEDLCTQCGLTVTWLTVTEVHKKTGKTCRTVYNWINSEWVHARRLPDRWWLICARSVEASPHLAHRYRSPGPPNRPNGRASVVRMKVTEEY
jgi:hypothetical protein